MILAERRPGRRGLVIAFANPAYSQMTGYAPAELIGAVHGFQHHHATDLPNLRRWHRRLTAGPPLAGEGYLKHKNGVRLYTSWTFSALADARGRVTRVVGTYRDLTEKRRLHDALMHAQRLDAVGRLAGGVAHDFNNLLSVINGYCEMLSTTVAGNKRARKELAEIHQAAQRATSLVRQLLAFGRRQNLDPRIVSLDRLIGENAEILTRLLSPDKALQLSLDSALDNVRADPHQLQQVLLNLTINARDALPAGGRVTISTGVRETKASARPRATDLPPGRYVALAISDNGSGMDERTQAHLFEPFFTTKPEGRGTGLGLSLVHGVVQQSGGHIFVHSTPGLGTTFEILLPAVRQPTSAGNGATATIPVAQGRETIVLMDGDEVVRKMVAGMLTADGYHVLAAPAPAGVLDELSRQPQPVHLVILDGRRVSRVETSLIRSLRESNTHLRVLRVTDEEPRLLPGVPPHLQRALSKPFALSTLLQSVRELLDAGIDGAAPASRRRTR